MARLSTRDALPVLRSTRISPIAYSAQQLPWMAEERLGV